MPYRLGKGFGVYRFAMFSSSNGRFPQSSAYRITLVQGRGFRVSQKCEAVPRRARISGSYTFLSLNSGLESNKEEEEDHPGSALRVHPPKVVSHKA